MGINIQINNQEFLNQFDNGVGLNLTTTTNTSFLNGNSGELIKNTIEVQISWTSQSSATDIFEVTGNTLTRSGTGDFITDGFVVGDIIDGWELSPLGAVFTDREITAITSSQIDFDGAVVPLTTFTDGEIYGKTPLESLYFKYGLIENTESLNFVSKIDGIAENEYFASGIGFDTGGGVRDINKLPMISTTGVNSWKDDGFINVKFDQTLSQHFDFAQVFKVFHVFRLYPYYLDGWSPNLTTLSPPFPEWQSTSCLKYVSNFEFRQFLNNPNGARSQNFGSIHGNTGWFDENFNGLTNQYNVDSVTITDNATSNPLTALDFQKSCHVVVVVNSLLSGWNTGKDIVTVGVSYLPNINQYQQNQNTIEENFIFDYALHKDGDPATSSTIITNLEITTSTPSQNTIEFDVEYSVSQQALLSNQSYLIMVGVNKLALTGINSDRVMLLADHQPYSFTNDVYDLMFMDEFKFVPHDLNEASTNLFGDYKGWVEDGFQIQAPFKLNTDDGAILDSISLDIVAFNDTTNAQFTLQTTNLDLSSGVVVGGVQQLTLNSVNNFILDLTSDFKKIELANTGSSTHGIYNVELYDTKVGVRFNFEEWIALLTANSNYYNPSQLNNGLNLLSSNYSTRYTLPLADTFELKARLNANVRDSNNVVTNYQFLSNDLKSYYYDKDGDTPTNWECNIETFDTTGNLVDIIFDNTYTDVKATFTKNPLASPTPSDLIGAWGWIRLDVTQGTINTPFEISTIYEPISSPIIPLPSELICKLTNSGATITLECRIDGTLIPSGSQLSLSARLSESSNLTFEVTNCDGGGTEYTDTELSAYIGQIIGLSNGLCYTVVGSSTETATLTGLTVTGSDYADCETCIVANLKTLESGGIKTLENGTQKSIE